jgi:hypothetical protein
MELIKSFEGKKCSYLSILSINLSLSFGVSLKFGRISLISTTIGIGVVEFTYSLQKVPYTIKK